MTGEFFIGKLFPHLLIDTPTGDQVHLGDVAEVRVVPYPTVIRHDATLRSLDVTAGARALAAELRRLRG